MKFIKVNTIVNNVLSSNVKMFYVACKFYEIMTSEDSHIIFNRNRSENYWIIFFSKIHIFVVLLGSQYIHLVTTISFYIATITH